jgi:cytochrome c peroxidase
MSPADRFEVDRVAANAGKALEAMLRKVVTGPSDFDRFVQGKPEALGASARRGLVVLVRAGCLHCHSGPLWSDERFYNFGLPPIGGAEADRGRARGVEILRANPFNARGAFSDGGPREEPPARAAWSDEGAFRTPSLRNVARTRPYGHDGRWKTLKEAVAFMATLGGAPPFGADDMRDAIDFLTALNGDDPPPPWNDWPHY